MLKVWQREKRKQNLCINLLMLYIIIVQAHLLKLLLLLIYNALRSSIYPDTTPVHFTSNNSFANLCRNKENNKFNHIDKFKRPKFKQTYYYYERTGWNNTLKKDSYVNPLLRMKVRTKSVLDLKLLDRMKLTSVSHFMQIL